MNQEPTLPQDEDDSSQDKNQASPAPKEQVRQARFVLLQLQWLVIVLLIGAVVWLRHNQSILIEQVENRLKVTEEFSQRLNNIDDKLFALTPASSRIDVNEQVASNDLQLISVQLTAANRLYESGDYTGAEEVLKSVRYQLEAGQLAISAPLRSALKQALDKDSEYLEASKNQPDDWLLQTLGMRKVQAFLRTLPTEGQNVSRRELAIRDANTSLALGIGASTLRERDLLTGYLQEVLIGLELVKKLEPSTNTNTAVNANTENNSTKSSNAKTQGNASQVAKGDDDKDGKDDIANINEAIFVINDLLANRPKTTPLASPQILKSTSKAPTKAN